MADFQFSRNGYASRAATPAWCRGAGAPASSKLATFAETLDELLASRHEVLEFSQFVKHLKLIEEYLAGTGIAFQSLDGPTPARARAERIAAFRAGAGAMSS